VCTIKGVYGQRICTVKRCVRSKGIYAQSVCTLKGCVRSKGGTLKRGVRPKGCTVKGCVVLGKVAGSWSSELFNRYFIVPLGVGANNACGMAHTVEYTLRLHLSQLPFKRRDYEIRQ
jgi:hypothetical protein